jgi:hypothetical protein
LDEAFAAGGILATAVTFRASGNSDREAHHEIVNLRSRSDALVSARTRLGYSQSLPTVLTLVGGVAALGLAIREGVVLAVRRRSQLALLAAVGARRSDIVWTAVLLEAVAMLVAVLLAFLAVAWGSMRWILAPALPPVLTPWVLAGLAAAWFAYVGTLIGATRRSLRDRSLFGALMSGINV